MDYLSAEDMLRIHSGIIDETGGSHGVRDMHAIKTLEDLPRQEMFGKETYSSVFLKSALYIRTIIFSHPFVDGNKRTAMAAADVFLQLHGYEISVREGGVEKFALSVISEHHNLENIAAWLKKNTKKISACPPPGVSIDVKMM